MSYILGLDTGGTYTDGVLIDTESEAVVSRAKTLTTKHDLKIGIEMCIDSLNIENTKAVKMVSLSTTLATNAVVENKVGRTGLILIGQKNHEKLPDVYVESIEGDADIKGNIIKPVSEEQAREAVRRLKDKVDAIAISAYASVRNPKQEQTVKNIVVKESSLPVFCAHELSASLGYVERTTTAVLNAGLIGIINDFITATKESLKSRNIDAEIMVVKSDGSLMREEAVITRPIDTILSGSAAGAIGAYHLTKEDNALILDMGGTTIDIADITGGVIKTGDECAKVGGRKTKVHAVETSTHGIGGDSLLKLTAGNKIEVGPRKAEPVSRCAALYHHMKEELISIFENKNLTPKEKEKLSRCYHLVSGRDFQYADAVVKLLKDGPHSLAYIINKAGADSEESINQMLCSGEVNPVEITPTDILHIRGKYGEWDCEAAIMRCDMLAAAGGLTREAFTADAEAAIHKMIIAACIQAVADFEDGSVDIMEDEAAEYLIDKLVACEPSFLTVGCSLNKPVIAVGAPAKAWLPFAARMLNAEIIYPENADVANAIGSALGEVKEKASALIRREKGKRKYILYLPGEKKVFASRKAALAEAEEALARIVRDKACDAGCSKPDITIDSRDLYTHTFADNQKKYVETQISACAKGRPDGWAR